MNRSPNDGNLSISAYKVLKNIVILPIQNSTLQMLYVIRFADNEIYEINI